MGYLTASLEKELEDLEIKIYQGKFFETIDRLDEILNIENISIENRVRALNHKSLIEFYLGIFIYNPERFKTAYDLALKAYEEVLKTDNPSLQYFTISHLLWSKYRLGISSKSDDLRQKFDSIYKKMCHEDPAEAKKLEPYL